MIYHLMQIYEEYLTLYKEFKIDKIKDLLELVFKSISNIKVDKYFNYDLLIKVTEYFKFVWKMISQDNYFRIVSIEKTINY